MRASLIAAVVVAAAAAIVWGIGLPDADGPDESVQRAIWHPDGTVTFTDRFCGDCHYGLTEMWRADWTLNDSNWTLAVQPAYQEAPLYAVHAVPSGVNPVLWESGAVTFDWNLGQAWVTTFEVSDGAGAVFARVHGTSSLPRETDILESRRHQYVTALRLIGPDGTAHDAAGPEDDVKLITIRDPAAGTWTMEATLLGGDAPRAIGTAFMEVLAGNVTTVLAETTDVANWTWPAGPQGEPPEVTLRLQPYHDHGPYQHTDWDLYDSSPFTIQYAPRAGPAPAPPSWNATAVNAIWGDIAETVVLDRTGRFTDAYIQEPGHNDAGFGSSYPAFGPTGSPVWPGTAFVRFEMTWTGNDDAPMMVKFSPHGTPYFFQPREVERGPGRAVWEMPVQPSWWEAPDQTRTHGHGGELGEPTSDWDIAPYLAYANQDLVVGDVAWRLTVTAVR